MNEAVVLRRWRIAAIVLVAVVIVLSLLLVRSCSTAFTDGNSVSGPTPTPQGTEPGSNGTSSPTLVPTPQPTDDASGSGSGGTGNGDGNGNGNGAGAGGRGGGSGSGNGNGHGGTLVAFAVAGNAPGALEPGLESSIDLKITNPNGRSIRVTSVTATLTGLTAPNASGSLPCSLADFDLTQLGGSPTIIVPGNASRTLSDLGIPQSQWPVFSMINTASNQDGCKGAVLSIHYAASGRGA